MDEKSDDKVFEKLLIFVENTAKNATLDQKIKEMGLVSLNSNGKAPYFNPKTGVLYEKVDENGNLVEYDDSIEIIY